MLLQALDLPQTPINEDHASIELPEHHVEAAETGHSLDSPIDLAVTDPPPDIPAADVDEPMSPVVKPELMDLDLEPMPAPVSRRKFMLCVQPPSLESVMADYKRRADWAKVCSLSLSSSGCGNNHKIDYREETEEGGGHSLEDARRSIRSAGSD